MTSVQALVEEATNEYLLQPDWGVNMNIIDMINANPDLAAVFIRAVKKRIGSKDHRVQHLGLCLLEALMKNCGRPVYAEVSSKSFMKEMVHVVTTERKKGATTPVHDKVLELIEDWSNAFSSMYDRFPLFADTFNDLKKKGFNFPPRDPNATAAMIDPSRAPPPRRRVVAQPPPVYPPPSSPPGHVVAGYDAYGRQVYYAQPSAPRSHAHGAPAQVQPPPVPVESRPPPVRDEQAEKRKLQQDLRVVHENATLLHEMIEAADEGEDLRQSEVVQDLVRVLGMMQPRLRGLVEGGNVGEDLLSDVLKGNDSLLRALEEYENHINHVSGNGTERVPPVSNASDVLLDFGEEPATAPTAPAGGRVLGGDNVSSQVQDESGVNNVSDSNELNVADEGVAFDEIARRGKSPNKETVENPEEGGFDDFLNERLGTVESRTVEKPAEKTSEKTRKRMEEKNDELFEL